MSMETDVHRLAVRLGKLEGGVWFGRVPVSNFQTHGGTLRSQESISG